MNDGNNIKEDFKFSKEGRLHHRSLIEGLFRKGKTFYEFPFRVIWRKLTEDELQNHFRDRIPEGIGKIQMMVSVPKKKRRKAVDRVLIRRRVKEAYRLNRLDLLNNIEGHQELRTLSFGLVYIHDANLSYKAIEESLRTLLYRLQTKVISQSSMQEETHV